MKALIGFDRYSIFCVIGIYPEERRQEQEILIDLRVSHDIQACVVDDVVTQTLCYVQLAELCAQLAKNGQYQLLETLAAAIIQEIKTQFGNRKIWLRIRKPKAIPDAEAAIVEVTWEGH